MSQHKTFTYRILWGITVIITLVGIITLIPDQGVSKSCLIGYKAHCSFAPISTILCFFLAAMSCVIRKRLVLHS